MLLDVVAIRCLYIFKDELYTCYMLIIEASSNRQAMFKLSMVNPLNENVLPKMLLLTFDLVNQFLGH